VDPKDPKDPREGDRDTVPDPIVRIESERDGRQDETQPAGLDETQPLVRIESERERRPRRKPISDKAVDAVARATDAKQCPVILVVDDDQYISRSWRRILTHIDPDAEVLLTPKVADAKDAIDHLWRITCVVLDHRLANGYGPEVVEAIRKKWPQPPPQVIVTSGYDTDISPDLKFREPYLRIDPTVQFIPKPTPISDIERVLLKYIKDED
jgi:ActR/RegA family two-component response regulator